jgi:hypothetical protein
MRKLAWQKLAPLLLCGLIATGCEQDKNSLTEPINWQSILSESLADLDIENISVDQLLGILNSLSLFPDDIIGIDENCLAESGDIGSSLASNRSITCQLQLSNGEWVSIVVNRDLFGLDNIPNNKLQSGPSFTFNPSGETTTNPDPEIRNPLGDNELSAEVITGNRDSAGVTVNGVSAQFVNYSGISTSLIPFNPFNTGQLVNVSESNSNASLGFFSILLFGQRTFQYFCRQYQAKKMKK